MHGIHGDRWLYQLQSHMHWSYQERAVLDSLKVLSCDIWNTYLMAKCHEKIWTRAGPEFGLEAGQIMFVVRALYGLKSSRAAFRALVAETIGNLGYNPSKADPDVWLCAAVKLHGFEYYEYVLCYVDDVLVIAHDAMAEDDTRHTGKLQVEI